MAEREELFTKLLSLLEKAKEIYLKELKKET